jgi:hypothetical protein
MFVYYFTHVARPLSDLATVLVDDPGSALEADLNTACAEVASLLGQRLATDPPCNVTLAIGPPIRRAASVVLPVRAVGSGAQPFARLDANLEAGDLGGGRAQLSLQGTYEPGSGPPWDLPAEQAHRMAEAVMKHFVERIAVRAARARS